MRPPRIKDCPGVDCPGAYRASNLPPDHPWADRLVPCACTLRRQADHLARQLPVEIRRMRFESFRANANTERAFTLAQQFAARPWDYKPFLTFVGPNRVGKTHLAAAITNDLLDRGEPTWFARVTTVLEDLRNGYDTGAYQSRLNTLMNASLLVLDDLGAEQTQAGDPFAVTWSQERLFQILDQRLLDQAPTVITTNRLPHMLSQRIASRLWDERHSVVVALDPNSDRRRKASR